MKRATPMVRRIAQAAVTIEQQDEPEGLAFNHAVLCQVALPRREHNGNVFERTSGNSSLRLESGALFMNGKWHTQGVPYGSKPRLTILHLSTEAVRTKSPIVQVEHSARAFLKRIGVDTSGGASGGYTMFAKQMKALAACRLQLGFSIGDHNMTLNTQPIRSFDAWVQSDGRVWPGVMELSTEFFESLREHAVPLDHTALAALKHSALCLDIYSYLAHRLCRIRKPQGQRVSWQALYEQFGQEYKRVSNFKRDFLHALKLCLFVYPDARVELLDDGLLLHASPPPVARKMISM